MWTPSARSSVRTPPSSCLPTRRGPTSKPSWHAVSRKKCFRAIGCLWAAGSPGRIAASRWTGCARRVARRRRGPTRCCYDGPRSLSGVPLVVGAQPSRGVARRIIETSTLHRRGTLSRCNWPVSESPMSSSATRRPSSSRPRGPFNAAFCQRRSQRSTAWSSPAASCPPDRPALGGDWFDAFSLPERSPRHRHGRRRWLRTTSSRHDGPAPAAAAPYALEFADPAAVLDRLNRKIMHFEPGEMATVLYLVVAPDRTHPHRRPAGHPPAIAARRRASPVSSTVRPSPPIGLDDKTEHVNVHPRSRARHGRCRLYRWSLRAPHRPSTYSSNGSATQSLPARHTSSPATS